MDYCSLSLLFILVINQNQVDRFLLILTTTVIPQKPLFPISFFIVLYLILYCFYIIHLSCEALGAFKVLVVKHPELYVSYLLSSI